MTTAQGPVPVAVVRVAGRGEPLPLPRYETDGAAGMDLRADEPVELAPGERKLIPTGIAVAIPPGWEGQVRPRSGLALRHGLGLPNAPGTIDSDYRGEVGVILVNWGADVVQLPRGERIAQLVLCPVSRGVLQEVAELPPTGRGAGGFGSTGR